MKKIDIISAYNTLLPKLADLADHYEKATGQKYPESIPVYTLGSRALNWGKEELERYLNNVQRLATEIPHNEEIFINNRDFKESEQGKSFIANLEAKRTSLYNEIKETTKTFYESFNSILSSVGLSDWEIHARIPEEEIFPYILPTFRHTYFDIQKKDMMHASLHVTIDRNRGGWNMEVSSSMHCRVGGIQAKDEQYHQYKAYVIFHDFAIVFQTWMENNYADLANTVDRLIEEVDKVESQLHDPWSAWKEATM